MVSAPYNWRAKLPSIKWHFCAPRRMVPPKSDSSLRTSVLPSAFCHSVIKPTTGCGQVRSNSEEFAWLMPATWRANSMSATCIPKQIPKYGILFSRAYLAVRILPSTPREPKPPGTKIPSKPFKISTPLVSTSCESMYLIFTVKRFLNPACFKASFTDLYASGNSVYLPTIPMVTSPVGLACWYNTCSHSDKSASGQVKWKRLQMKSSKPWDFKSAGIW